MMLISAFCVDFSGMRGKFTEKRNIFAYLFASKINQFIN